MQEELSQAYAFRDNLINEGVIKQDQMGTIHTVDEPSERESLKKAMASKDKRTPNLLGAPDGDGVDLRSHQDFQSVRDDEDLEDLS